MTRRTTHCALRAAWLCHLAVLPLVALAWGEPAGQGAGAVPPPVQASLQAPVAGSAHALAELEQLLQDRHFAQALLLLESWRNASPDGLSERQRLLLLGRCLLGLERHAEALAALRAIEAMAPETTDDDAVAAGNLLGDALAALGRLDEAAEQWLKAAEMAPAASMAALIQKKASHYSRNRVEMDSATDAPRQVFIPSPVHVEHHLKWSKS